MRLPLFLFLLFSSSYAACVSKYTDPNKVEWAKKMNKLFLTVFNIDQISKIGDEVGCAFCNGSTVKQMYDGFVSIVLKSGFLGYAGAYSTYEQSNKDCFCKISFNNTHKWSTGDFAGWSMSSALGKTFDPYFQRMVAKVKTMKAGIPITNCIKQLYVLANSGLNKKALFNMMKLWNNKSTQWPGTWQCTHKYLGKYVAFNNYCDGNGKVLAAPK